jgi:lipid-binding SYLF domain-containing protein
MRKMNLVTAAFAAAVTCGLAPSSVLAKDEPAKAGTESKIVRNDALIIADASKAIKEITALPKRKIPPVLFNEATAVVIVPKASKQAFMVSGGTTGGVLLVHSKAGTWGSPVFVTISGGTLGWQIVGDPMDIILLFRNNRQIDAILKGKTTLDKKTSIVPGRVAATMKGASKEELGAEITSYVRGHGVFAEDAVVAGTTMQIDAAANDSYYARPKVDAGEIIAGKVAKPGEHAATLQKLLSDYAAAK